MFCEQLEIKGHRIQFQPHTAVKLTTRKIFDKYYFWNDAYKHEIANHYRDFKKRPNLRRHRRKFAFVQQLRKSHVNDDSCRSFREVLPMPIKDFDSFFAVYSSRGRRILCEKLSPASIQPYNDTLRRIRNTHTIKEFEYLLQRQLRTSQIQRGTKNVNKHHRVRCANTANRHKDKRNGVRSFNNSEQPKYVVERQSSVCWQRRGNQQKQRSLGNLASVVSAQQQQTQAAKPLISVFYSHGVKEFNHNNKSSDNKDSNDFAYYFQLAADYYAQGLLNNIEYLESIGTRTINAISKNKINRSVEPRTLSGESSSSNSSSSSSCKSIEDETTTTGTVPKHSVRRQSFSITSTTNYLNNSSSTSAPNPKLSNLIEFTSSRHREIQSRKIFRQFSDLQLHSGASFDTSNDWPISVNITPTNSKNLSKEVKPIDSKRTEKKLASKTPKFQNFGANIMNSYLIANGNNINKALQGNSNVKSAAGSTAAQEQQKFLQLIDNLENLEIRACNSTLPRITLSNYCSDANSESVSGRYAEYLDCDTELLQQQRASKAFILRESKFDFNNSLDIPNENIYHSEARPP